MVLITLSSNNSPNSDGSSKSEVSIVGNLKLALDIGLGGIIGPCAGAHHSAMTLIALSHVLPCSVPLGDQIASLLGRDISLMCRGFTGDPQGA